MQYQQEFAKRLSGSKKKKLDYETDINARIVQEIISQFMYLRDWCSG